MTLIHDGRVTNRQEVSVYVIMNDKNVNDLSPDGYSRFYVILDILLKTFTDRSREVSILDVGGCSPYLMEILDASKIKYKLTIVDILPQYFDTKADYIHADIIEADLGEDSYDAVVSTDVLEHIPKEKKDAFVKACIKISKSICIIAAPFETTGVNDAELLVNNFNKKLFGVGQQWLEEHFEYTKPEIDRTKKIIENEKYKYEHFGTNNLYSWIFSSHLNLLEAKFGLDFEQRDEINRTYNELIEDSIEFSGPSYRHFFVICKDKSIQKKMPFRKEPHQTNPEQFSQYVHDSYGLIATKFANLNANIEDLSDEIEKINQEIFNEKTYSNKLNDLVKQQQAILDEVGSLRHLAKIRHPKRLYRTLRKRMGK